VRRAASKGSSIVEIRPAPGYEAEIIKQAKDAAVLQVTNDMVRDSAISSAVKRLM
jgi:hypothetical protein